MMKILVGYDGSESADAALIDLQRAGLPREAEALIVSAADVITVPDVADYEFASPGLPSRRLTAGLIFAEKHTERLLKEAQGFANKGAERVRSYFPTWDVRTDTLEGTPSWELIRKADEWKPDLVVVGSHGRSALGRFVLGSVSKKIVTDSDHSVRVTRGKISMDQPSLRIVIGVNGSTESENAVRAVGHRVWPQDTEVRIIAVNDGTSPGRISRVLPNVAAMAQEQNQESASAAERMVEWAQNELSIIGLKASVAIEKGDPREVIIRQAQEWDADSIFVGGRRFSSAFERLRLGSVATGLVTNAHCSVEVVRS